MKQQYLLVSASLQSILKNHLKEYRTLDNLADKVAIHINDTHPALCVPELMRLLIDDYGYGWDEAWDITGKTLAYTNHTVMSEALERWAEICFGSSSRVSIKLYVKLTAVCWNSSIASILGTFLKSSIWRSLHMGKSVWQPMSCLLS